MPRYQSPVEVHGVNKILDEGIDVKDIEVKDLLFSILSELRIMNKHLLLITDEEMDIDEEMEVKE